MRHSQPPNTGVPKQAAAQLRGGKAVFAAALVEGPVLGLCLLRRFPDPRRHLCSNVFCPVAELAALPGAGLQKVALLQAD
jgi:hypothetical protein